MRLVHAATLSVANIEAAVARYQQWFDNARRLKDLVAKLEITSLAALESAEGWTARSAASGQRPSTKAGRPDA